MYIYAPGAGCTDDAKLVTPGDELIFSSMCQWEERQAPLLSEAIAKQETVIASTCLPANTTEPTRPFKEPLPKQELVELSHKNFAPDTMKKVRWAVKMYRDRRQYRHSLDLEKIECNLDDRATINKPSLCFVLCCFITEVKKVDGSVFPSKTLYDILICIRFHLECLGFAFKVINDEAFHDVKHTLDNMMKEHVASGIGLTVKQAEVLSVTDEDYL